MAEITYAPLERGSGLAGTKSPSVAADAPNKKKGGMRRPALL